MNIAYLISAHTDPGQLRRLTEALRAEGVHFFVHIDRKSCIDPFLQEASAPDVHFLEERIDVRWGTINEWYYQRLLIEAAVHYPLRFGRLVTLSGLDYPLWSTNRIKEFFASLGEREYIAAMPMRKELRSGDIFGQVRPYFTLPIGNRWNQRLSILCRKMINLTGYRRSMTFKVGGREWRQYKGAAWWVMSETLAAYVLDTYEANKRDILRQFRHQHCPAETLVQTIVFNATEPEWKQRCVEFPWDEPHGLSVMTLTHHIDYRGAIRIWRAEDFDELMSTGKMFSRKFTTADSLALIKMIEDVRRRA